MIWAVPTAWAVMMPSWSIVATCSLSDDHSTHENVALAGDVVAVAVAVSPIISSFLSASTVMLLTFTTSP